MNEKYKEYCMKFSNEELKKYMIDYLTSNSWDNKLIRFLSEEGDEIEIDSSEKVGTIVFDEFDENLFINFYGIHTSILVHDIEIMFIDEDSKGTYTSSDVYNNVVYEGSTVNAGKGGMHMNIIHGKGGWNQKWMDFIDNNPNATSKDIYQFAGKMMDDYGLSGYTIHPYGGK